MMVDPGIYNLDPERYQELVNELYANYPPITLPPEYAFFVQRDMLRFLIRLARYKFVSRMVKKTDRVLEVGAGSGLGSIFLSQHCAHVTGLEVKTTEVEEARGMNRRSNVEFRLGDLFQLNANEIYDVVVALDVIEHMTTEEGRALVSVMSGHLNSEGMLVVGTPSIYSHKYQGALSRASHAKCYDLQELLEVVDGCFSRTIGFSMNDEMVHTGAPQMAWYYFVLAFGPKRRS